MLGGWLSGRWVVPHRGTGEPEAGVQVAPLPAGALQPLTSVGTFCWAPGEGSPLPEWGMGERRALAPLKTLPREVRAETEGLGPASGWRPPLPSESGQCQSGDWRGDGPALRTPRTPEGGRFRSPGQRFGWSSWQSGCGRDVNTGGAARRAKAVLARQV